MHEATRPQGGSIVVGECVPGTPYRVVGVLGKANAGSVYEVEHVELGKRFALKALPPEAARFDTVGRLRNEWRALARLAHPNIVAVSDAGTTPDGLPFFVMERLDGESLRMRLEREGRLRASEAIGIAAGVAAALGAAHRIGVVHRDVKPESIFLARGGRAKLLDFGLAKLHSAPSKLTAHGVTVGTPRYMAPEQALGERVDHRADFYALGLVLFEMLAGTGPFDDAEDTGAMLLRRATGEAPSLSTRAAGLPAELDALVAELLARDPAERPPDARSIADALQRVGSRLLAPVAHDSPTREALYSANTRPTMVPRAGEQPRRDAVPSGAQADATRPDGVAAQPSSPPPPVLDPNATVLAIPARRAVPPPLPVAIAADPTTIPLPVPAVPTAAAPAESRAPSKRAVAVRAALIGAGAGVMFLCCLALGWVLLGGAQNAGGDAAAIIPRNTQRSAQHAPAAAPSKNKHVPTKHVATKHVATKHVTAKHVTAKHIEKYLAAKEHLAAKPGWSSKPQPSATRHATPRRHATPAAGSTPVAANSQAPPLCQPEIPPNPYGGMPPSGL